MNEQLRKSFEGVALEHIGFYPNDHTLVIIKYKCKQPSELFGGADEGTFIIFLGDDSDSQLYNRQIIEQPKVVNCDQELLKNHFFTLVTNFIDNQVKRIQAEADAWHECYTTLLPLVVKMKKDNRALKGLIEQRFHRITSNKNCQGIFSIRQLAEDFKIEIQLMQKVNFSLVGLFDKIVTATASIYLKYNSEHNAICVEGSPDLRLFMSYLKDETLCSWCIPPKKY